MCKLLKKKKPLETVKANVLKRAKMRHFIFFWNRETGLGVELILGGVELRINGKKPLAKSLYVKMRLFIFFMNRETGNTQF